MNNRLRNVAGALIKSLVIFVGELVFEDIFGLKGSIAILLVAIATLCMVWLLADASDPERVSRTTTIALIFLAIFILRSFIAVELLRDPEGFFPPHVFQPTATVAPATATPTPTGTSSSELGHGLDSELLPRGAFPLSTPLPTGERVADNPEPASARSPRPKRASLTATPDGSIEPSSRPPRTTTVATGASPTAMLPAVTATSTPDVLMNVVFRGLAPMFVNMNVIRPSGTDIGRGTATGTTEAAIGSLSFEDLTSGIRIQNLSGVQDNRFVLDPMPWIATSDHPPMAPMADSLVPNSSRQITSFGSSPPGAQLLKVFSAEDIGVVVRTESISTRAAFFGNLPNSDTQVLVPLYTKRHFGQSTTLLLGNLSPLGSSIRVHFSLRSDRSAALAFESTTSIPSGRAILLSPEDQQANFNLLTTGFAGSLRISASAPIVAIAIHHFATNPGVLIADEAIPLTRTSNELFAPIVARDFGAWNANTGFAIQNAEDHSVNIRIVYTFDRARVYGVGSTLGTQQADPDPIIEHFSLPPLGGALRWLGSRGTPGDAWANLPLRDFVGSATISADDGRSRLAAVIHYTDGEPSFGDGYDAMATDGLSRCVALPLIRSTIGDRGVVSGVSIVNHNNDAADVFLQLYDESGLIAPCDNCEFHIDPNRFAYWSPRDLTANGFSGSAVIVSNHAVAVIVNEYSTARDRIGDMATYVGIPLRDCPVDFSLPTEASGTPTGTLSP